MLPLRYKNSTTSTFISDPTTTSVLESRIKHGQNGLSFRPPAEILGVILKSNFTSISNEGTIALYAVLERFLLRSAVPHRPEKERSQRGAFLSRIRRSVG